MTDRTVPKGKTLFTAGQKSHSHVLQTHKLNAAHEPHLSFSAAPSSQAARSV